MMSFTDVEVLEAFEAFERCWGRKPTGLEQANIILEDAQREVKNAEAKISAAESQLLVLRLRLERARAAADARRLVRDEAALAELAQTFPPLSDLQKKCALVGLPLT